MYLDVLQGYGVLGSLLEIQSLYQFRDSCVAFLVLSWNSLRWWSDSTKGVSCLHSCLWVIKTQPRLERCQVWGSKIISLSFAEDFVLLALSNSPLPFTWIFSCWVWSWDENKHLQWFSVETPCPWRMSLNTLEFYSSVIGKRSWHWQMDQVSCSSVIVVLVFRWNSVFGQSSLFGQSMSPMVESDWKNKAVCIYSKNEVPLQGCWV